MKRARTVSKLQKYKNKLGKDGVSVSGRFEVYVICTGSMGYSKSVVIKTDLDKYMFNCGETTLKNFTQVLSAAHAIDNIFFTYNNWSNIGGLIGTMISMNTCVARSQPVTIHGPQNVERVLSMSRHFSQLEAMSDQVLSIFKCRSIEEGLFTDTQLSVEYVKLVCQPSEQNQSTHNSEFTANQSTHSSELTAEHSTQNSGLIADQSTNSPELTANQSTHSSELTTDQPVSTSGTDSEENQGMEAEEEENVEKYAVAYIVTPAARLRAIDPKKLKELNIPRGPWIGQLAAEETVTLEDGRVIHPEDVTLPNTGTRRPIIVLECPTKGFLDSLLDSEQLRGLMKDPERMPQLIVHMSSADVIDDLRYKTFMDRYGSDVCHIMLNEECKPTIAPKTLHLQSSLNYLHQQMFPLLTSHFKHDTRVASTTGGIIPGVYGLTYVARPEGENRIQWNNTLNYEGENRIELAREKVKDFDNEFQQLKDNLGKMTSSKDPAKDLPEILFLGTGSAEPSIRRNASGILVQIKQDEYMLLDCGEGTLAQLYQVYGTEVDNILANIKAIFISHLHYDHHGGVFNVAEARFKALRARGREDDLHLIAPKQYHTWLNVYSKYVKEGGGNMVLHSLQSIHDHAIVSRETEHLEQLKALLRLKEICCVPVIHTKHSHAVVMTHEDGWKLVYSGDTRPCQALVKYGKDCDILIHEGSFDDFSYDNAVQTRHSTTGEAIDVGEKMGAKFTLLTHFSQRIRYVPAFSEKFTENVGFSFDFMKVKPSQLRQIPLLKPMLFRLFVTCEQSSDYPEEDDNTLSKKKRKRKNKQNKSSDDIETFKSITQR